MSLWLGNKQIKQLGVVFTEGDTSQLQASNIRKGASILGINGTFSDGSMLGGNTAATAGNIMSGYSAFVDGNRVDGSLEVNNYYTGTAEPTSDIGKNGDIYLKK
jgi:hypothetical protein